MKSFKDWFKEQAPAPATPVAEPELPEWLSQTPNGAYYAICRCCETAYIIEGLPDDFTGVSYCGRSERCLP